MMESILVETHLSALRDRVSALEALAAVDRLILAGAQLEPVVDELLDRIPSVMRCEYTCIALPSVDRPGLWDLHLESHGAGGPGRVLLPRQSGAEVHRPLLGPVPAALRHAGAELVQAWPVTLDTRVVAILGVGFRDAIPADPSIDDTLESFAQRLSLALARSEREERLYRQAHFDELTGLPNRRSKMSRIASEISRSERLQGELAVIVLDVDGFKQINDSYGHAVGDQVLREISRALLGSLRTYDMCVRFAGDEFVVVLGDCSPDAAELKRQELQRHVESIEVELDSVVLRVGASAGAAVYPHDGRTYDALIATADRRMYTDKALRRRFTRSSGRDWDQMAPTTPATAPVRPPGVPTRPN